MSSHSITFENNNKVLQKHGGTNYWSSLAIEWQTENLIKTRKLHWNLEEGSFTIIRKKRKQYKVIFIQKVDERGLIIMDYLTYAEALIEINRQYRADEIDFDLSCKLTNFCEQLHNLWKEKVNKSC